MHFDVTRVGQVIPPHILWLTWIDPYPEQDGQRLYSGRLIDAVAAAGARINVLCFSSETPIQRKREPARGISWWTVPRRERPKWASVFSSLPNVAYRCATEEMKVNLRRMVASGYWDKVVFDGLSAGWALPILEPIRDSCGGRPDFIYVAHNHEESTRADVAADYRGLDPLMRFALFRDARKAGRLERHLVDAADLVTAITPEDAEKFRQNAPDKHMAVLPPGYGGQPVRHREITADTPRLAVIAGSFDWVAKRMNLEAFLARADPVFAKAGIRLRVVGGGPSGYLEKLAPRMRATEFLGRVPRIAPHIADARIAIVPELTGGGFKLKVLDYVFNRLPVLAIAGSTAGTPLKTPMSMLAYASMESLVEGVVRAIDDLPLLNRLQNCAYDTCVQRFDWGRRGEEFLMHAVSE